MSNNYVIINGNVLVNGGTSSVLVTGTPSVGEVIEATSATAASWQTISSGTVTLSGDVTGASNANTVVDIHGASVPAAGSLTTGNVLQVSGSSALSYGALNLAGGANYVTNALPVANLANGTAAQLLVTNAGATAPAWVSITGDSTITAAGAMANVALTGGSGVVNIASTGNILTWAAATTAPGLAQTTAASDVATANLTITSQAPYASASTNKNPGSVVLNTPAPIAGGSKGTVLIQDGGATYATFQDSNSGGLGLTGSALTFSGNGTIQTDNSILYLSVASAGGNNQIINWLPVSGGEVVTVADWFTLQDITQAPIARFVTGAGSGNASFNWWYGVTPTYTQVTPVSDVATASTTIRAQSAYASASINVTGGNLILQAGTGTTAANDGYIQTKNSLVTSTATKTSDYTITYADHDIFCNFSSGANITLPAPINGLEFHIWDISGTAETNNITLVRHGSENISGIAASRVLNANWGHWLIKSNGTDWFLS